MKKTLLIAGFSSFLGLSAATAGSYHDHDHDYDHDDHDSYNRTPLLAPTTDPKSDFLSRLATAPRGGISCGGCMDGFQISNGIHRLNSLANAALSCRRVEMLGKVEYCKGESWLGEEARHAIESAIFNARGRFNANTLAVVFGFADRSGSHDINLEISHSRAFNVKKYIDQLNWSYNLSLDSTVVAMGEEVELCRHHLDHNRVAEIWLVEFPAPVTQVIEVIKPSVATAVTSLPMLPAPAAQAQPLQVLPAQPQMQIQQVLPAPAPVITQPHAQIEQVLPAPAQVIAQPYAQIEQVLPAPAQVITQPHAQIEQVLPAPTQVITQPHAQIEQALPAPAQVIAQPHAQIEQALPAPAQVIAQPHTQIEQVMPAPAQVIAQPHAQIEQVMPAPAQVIAQPQAQIPQVVPAPAVSTPLVLVPAGAVNPTAAAFSGLIEFLQSNVALPENAGGELARRLEALRIATQQ